MHLGSLLSALSYDDVFVPAADLNKEVSLSLKEVSFGEALKTAGMISRPREPDPSDAIV
jgi:hypothetical protein